MAGYEDALPEGFEVKSMPEGTTNPNDVMPDEYFPKSGASEDPNMQLTEAPQETGRGNAALPALQGLTFGWGDEALAGALAAYGTFMPELAGGLPDQFSMPENFEGIKESLSEARESYGKNYEGIRDGIRDDTEIYAEENPATSALAEAGGAMLTGGAGIAKLGAKPTANVIQRLMKNAGIGAAEGAIYGAGKGEEGTRLQGAKDEALTGAIFGGAGGEVIRKVGRYLSGKTELQDHILKKIQDGSEDMDTAFYKVLGDAAKDVTPPVNLNAPRLAFDGADDVAEEVLNKARPVGTPRLAKDRAQVNAARQGVGEGVLPVIRQANPATRGKLSEMNRILEKVKGNARDALTMRPSDVVGNSALERFKHIRTVNRQAGEKLEVAANDLKKFRVDFDPSVNQFITDLQGVGVRVGTPEEFMKKINMGNINERKRALFTGSDFEGMDAAEEVIDKVLQRMKSNGNGMSAYEGHRLKKYLDTKVNFGAMGDKIKDMPQLENVLKHLRHNIDTKLDDSFDNYRLANEDYANTITVMNEFKRIMPKHVDLLDPSKQGTSAIGTELRAVMSNRKSRIPTFELLKSLDNVSQQYGKHFDDDMLTQIMYMDELERITGSGARTGLANEVQKGLQEVTSYMRKSPTQAVQDYAIDKADNLFFGEINDANLIKALDELLKVD